MKSKICERQGCNNLVPNNRSKFCGDLCSKLNCKRLNKEWSMIHRRKTKRTEISTKNKYKGRTCAVNGCEELVVTSQYWCPKHKPASSILESGGLDEYPIHI